MTVEKTPLFILLGPTAVGKTGVSVKIAEKLEGEIISADSMQIYKYMDIGTAKIKEEEMKDIPHYMIDIVYPDEEFTVADYKEAATVHIEDIYNRGKLPMIVGGTGFYINSLIYQLSFTQVSPNYILRDKYLSLADKYGNDYIYNQLKEIDPKSAKRIHKNDRKRVIRALEIYNETGKPMSDYYKDLQRPNNKYDLTLVGLSMERPKLYSRINKRVELMIKEGLLGEVENLLKMGYDKSLTSMKGIGYEEVIKYFEGELSLEEAINLIKQKSRRLAKRQLTWFRRNKDIKWIDIDKFADSYNIENDIISYIKKK